MKIVASVLVAILVTSPAFAIQVGETSEKPGGGRMGGSQGNSAGRQEQINRDNERKMQSEMNQNKGRGQNALVAAPYIPLEPTLTKPKPKKPAPRKPTSPRLGVLSNSGSHANLGPGRPVRPNEGPTRPDRPDTGPSPKPTPEK